MKKQIAKITVFLLCAAGLLAAPALSRAQTTATNAPVAKEKKAAKKENNGAVPFKGNLKAVDANAMTLSVNDLTLNVTSDTKISKSGKPAVLADGVVGEPVSGTFKKSDDGKMNALTIHFGAKAAGKKKQLSTEGNN